MALQRRRLAIRAGGVGVVTGASFHDPAPVGEPDELTSACVRAVVRIRAQFAVARAVVAAWRLPDDWCDGTDPHDPGYVS